MRTSASFHRDSRSDSLSSDTARETIRKISFKPTSRESSHPGQVGTAYLPRYQTRHRADGEMKYICPGGIGFRHAQLPAVLRTAAKDARQRRSDTGLTWAFAWQVLDSNQGRRTSTVLQGAVAPTGGCVVTCGNILFCACLETSQPLLNHERPQASGSQPDVNGPAGTSERAAAAADQSLRRRLACATWLPGRLSAMGSDDLKVGRARCDCTRLRYEPMVSTEIRAML